jgi:6-phosphofructokinase 1
LKILAVVSGGDAPGINAALYSLAVQVARAGASLIGAVGGFPAVLNEQLVELTPRLLLPWAAMAGSYLPSSRVPVLAQPDAQAQMQVVLAKHKIDALVVFGGDGTLRHIPPLLAQWGVAFIGLPTTIDNDVPGTEMTLGFDSACNFAYPVIDGMRATGHALAGRIFTLETLGGSNGNLALAIAHAAAADAVLLPEYAYTSEPVCARLQHAAENNGFALLVYTEFLPDKEALLAAIPQRTGIRIRSTQLGHAQRGGAPTHRDRALAAAMAGEAIAALGRGVKTGIVVVRDDQTMLYEGTLADYPARLPDRALYDRINGWEK